MNPEENEVEMPENRPLHGDEPGNSTLEQNDELSAIMHFNADKRFSITE